MIGAADRDERKYADPDRFDMFREIRQHVGFGFGVHVCLGVHLARMESRVRSTPSSTGSARSGSTRTRSPRTSRAWPSGPRSRCRWCSTAPDALAVTTSRRRDAEGARPLRGTSASRVDGARTSSVTSGEGVPTSAVLPRAA